MTNWNLLTYDQKILKLEAEQEELLKKKNLPLGDYNGIYLRYAQPVLTAAHVPLEWRFDIDPTTNPFLQERLGINAVFNPGAILFNGKICLVARVEGYDRKSFFAIAESDNGIDNFRFWDEPILLPQTEEPDANVYDMRLTAHEDGYIYGVFCTERKDTNARQGDFSAAIAQAGIVRTKNLKDWERLPDLKTPSSQQRNCVLHPEFVSGQYAFYTRPMDGFIDTGSGGGIGWGLVKDMNTPTILEEKIIESRRYHTINEGKNGEGPAPIKTSEGWLHLAHGVRNTAAGLRYVLYLYMTSLENPEQITYRPSGYLMAPKGTERVGDVSNVLFANGWVVKGQNVFLYYASSDTRCHVATSTLAKLLDYCKQTPDDKLYSNANVASRLALIRKNKRF